MRISEMNTKQAANCLCLIAAPLGRIGEDAVVNAYLKSLSSKKGATMMQLISGAVSELIPALLNTHYEDTVAVIAALTSKTAQEIEEQNILATLRDVRGSIDKDLIDFFTASVGMDGGK